MGTRFEELTTVDTSAIAVARTAIVPVIFIFCFVYVYDNIALQSETKTKWKSQSKFYWRHQSSATRKKVQQSWTSSAIAATNDLCKKEK